MSAKRETSAGVVIICNDDNLGPCVLMLKVYGNYDLPKGHVDIEDADDPSKVGTEDQIRNTAKREALEECGFTIMDNPNFPLTSSEQIARLVYTNEMPITCAIFNTRDSQLKSELQRKIVVSGFDNLHEDELKIIKKVVYLYVAETQCQAASIEKSPSGIYEHDSYMWCPHNLIEGSRLNGYLKPGVEKALSVYKLHKKVEEAIRKLPRI